MAADVTQLGRVFGKVSKKDGGRKVAATAVIAAGLSLMTPASTEARWYVAHMSAEICVPLDDIDFETFTRLYYGTGDMHAPEDMALKFEQAGAVLKWLPQKSTGPTQMMAFRLTFLNGQTTVVAFFNDEAACKFAMSRVQP